MKRITRFITLFVIGAALLLAPRIADAGTQIGPWSLAAPSCGTSPNPSGSVSSFQFGQSDWLFTINGTAGGGAALTTCTIQLRVACSELVNVNAMPWGMATDNTNGTALAVSFSATNPGGAGCSYGEVILTAPAGVTTIGGHLISLVIMW